VAVGVSGKGVDVGSKIVRRSGAIGSTTVRTGVATFIGGLVMGNVPAQAVIRNKLLRIKMETLCGFIKVDFFLDTTLRHDDLIQHLLHFIWQ
jgi:hypothetical protein